MKGPAIASPCGKMRTRSKIPASGIPALVVSAFAVPVLVACSTLGTPTVSGNNEEALYTPSQSNLASLSEVVQKHSNDPQAYNMRGAAYGAAGMNAEALADFNKAIGLDPGYGQAYANRGLVYRRTKQLDLALTDYDKALSLDGAYAPAYLGRGLATQRAEPCVARALSYLALGDDKAAATDLDQAVQMNPGDAKAWASRGLAYERLGQKEKAAGSYAKALNINDKCGAGATAFARVGGRAGQTYQTF